MVFLLIQSLQNVQQSAAHLITQPPRFCYSTTGLKDLYQLPVHLHIEFEVLLITYKVLQGQVSNYTQELLQPYQPSCNVRFSSKNILVKPCLKLNSYSKRTFLITAPDLWNLLPQDIKQVIMQPLLQANLKYSLLFKLLTSNMLVKFLFQSSKQHL